MATRNSIVSILRRPFYQLPRRRWVYRILFMICLVGLSTENSRAFAQQKAIIGVPLQQPQLSPYLDLLRTDNSALGPYHSFVRPRQQLRSRLNQQSAQIGQLQQQIQSSFTSPSGSISNRMQTGRGGTFQTYLHYYPTNQRQPGAPRGRPPR